jgi:hypothetical protein
MTSTYRSSPALPVAAPAAREGAWEMVFWGGVLVAALTRVAAGFARPGAFGAEPTAALLIAIGLVALMAQDISARRARRA